MKRKDLTTTTNSPIFPCDQHSHWMFPWQKLLPLLVIIAVGLICYVNTLSVPFYFDDMTCIFENPVVHDLKNLFDIGNYQRLGIDEDIRNSIVTRFITYLTFAANYRLHGLAVGGYHLVNLLIHLANALLIYQLVRLLLHSAQKNDWMAMVVALLFVTHPVQTTAVTYIVQRFALLATFFCLFALCTYLLSFRATTSGKRGGWYAGALISTVLAMYSKEIAFTLPLIITLCDWTFLPGTCNERLRRLAPFLATMILLPLTVMFLSGSSEITGEVATNAMELANLKRGSRWDYLLTQWPVIITYLRILIFPAGLHLDYDFTLHTSLWDPAVLFSGLLLIILFAFGIRLLLHRSVNPTGDINRQLIGFGIVWFFITLSMESSFIPLDDLIFEYRLYLPAFGFFLALIAALDLLRQRLAVNRPTIDSVATISVTLLILSLSTATILRNRIWQNELIFWQDNVSKAPKDARPRCNLADAYKKEGKIELAIAELENASRLDPTYWVPHEKLGDIHWTQKEYKLAAADYNEAGRRGNHSRQLALKLARSLRRSGDSAHALELVNLMLEIDPNDQEALTEFAALQP